jgi:hypothetical protein
MNAVVLPLRPGWRQIDPPRSKYLVADDLLLDVSAVQGLPEDPHEWIRVEMARRTSAQIAPAITRLTTETGWPVMVAETAVAGQKLLVAMYQFLELAAVAILSGPAARYDASIDDVKQVLMQAQVHWGAPPVTIAALLDGATDTKV